MESGPSGMARVFGFTRYLLLIAVIGLLVGAVAVVVFGGLMAVTLVVETFRHGEFTTSGARLLSTDLIELIDLFLLGTVLLITAMGLYQLFIEPTLHLPRWLQVSNLEQLKFNLVAVIVVMLAVLFLGAAANEAVQGLDLLAYGGGVALVILAISLAVWLFQRVHQHEEGHAHAAITVAEPVAKHERNGQEPQGVEREA